MDAVKPRLRCRRCGFEGDGASELETTGHIVESPVVRCMIPGVHERKYGSIKISVSASKRDVSNIPTWEMDPVTCERLENSLNGRVLS